MSNDQTFDPNLVEQTRLQIRAMVNEITQLSKLDVPPEEFHSEVLPKIVTALAAVGGALWTIDDRGVLSLGYQVNMQELRLGESEEGAKKHSRLLYKMLQTKEDGTLVMPRSGFEGSDEAGNPTDYLLVFAPVRTELETVGLIEIAQRADTGPVAQKGYVKFLGQMGGVVADYYKNRQLRNFGERQHLWTLLEEFTRTIHKTLDLRETAYTIVNEGRRLIECDRVSIAINYGGKSIITSVSGQDMVDKRSTTVKLLGKLATAVVRVNEPVWYTGDTSDFAPQVEKAVEDYVDESHTKMIAVFPLTKVKLEEVPEEDIAAREKPELPFGALIVEQIEDSRIPERMKKRVEIVADHACSALGNSMDHNSIFLMPLWRTIGKSKVLVSARMLPKTISISLAVIAAILLLIFVPWDFNMWCDGALEPIERRFVYPAIEGKIIEVYVDHDDVVQKGDVLAVMQNVDLEMKETQLLGERAELAVQLSNARKIRLDENTPQDQKQEVIGQIEAILERQKTNGEILEWYKIQKEDLIIKAPMSGTVITMDVKRNLLGHPVTRGIPLLEIADTDRQKPWRLELDMPEKRMGHVIDYQKSLQKQDPNAQLEVIFILASNPNINYHGRVATIHDRFEVLGEATGGNTVRIKATITDQDRLPDELRPGTSCKAKIRCGKQALGYVLFHEAIAFFQRQVLFRFF
ncbi:MAG: HlyD family efflux transporter periplasmic adaptor subunit [Planctomycetaceae bacterium]|nr:HlyD family efflux transporter periplasmic adaptor subunit [Planctomycetaceae bacterium]